MNNPVNKKWAYKGKQPADAKYFIEGIKNNNRIILSKAITLIESTHPKHRKIAAEIITQCLPLAGNAVRVGITGVPGVGKSTFIEAFGNYLVTKQKKKVAVLTIDPSSSLSKGSILGDKTRMTSLAANENAFIRPSPSSGALGGVSNATRESIILCEAAGYDVIIVETVGVGQSETTVHNMVDFFLLLMLAGAGDELQGIKRGIMEMADTIVINKADSGNEKHATIAAKAYQGALGLFPPTLSGWKRKVLTCSALENKNIDGIWQLIAQYLEQVKQNNFFVENRKKQAVEWFHQSIQYLLMQQLYENTEIQDKIKRMEKAIIENKKSPFNAAAEILSTYNEK